MKNKDIFTLEKIIKYIDDCKNFTLNMKNEEFLNDKKTLTACAFVISQIGELVKDLSIDLTQKYDNIPWHSIRGMRNKIVHDYDYVDNQILWITIHKDLPVLEEQLKEIVLKEK